MAANRERIKVRVTVPAAAQVALELVGRSTTRASTIRLARASAELEDEGSATVKLPFSKRQRKRLARIAKGTRLTLRGVATLADGGDRARDRLRLVMGRKGRPGLA